MNKKIIAFLSDCTDARVIKRMRGFKENGYEVISFSFRRQRYNHNYEPEWCNINLGKIRDQAYFSRVFMLIRALLLLHKHQKIIKEAHFIYAINLDLTLLAFYAIWIAKTKLPIIYEVADIQNIFLKSSISGLILRWLERKVLQKIHILVTTSPGFINYYFKPVQSYKGKWFLLENKLFPPYVPKKRLTSITSQNRPKREGGKRWVIGYFGVIRCEKSFKIINKVAKALPDKVVFYLGGIIPNKQKNKFLTTVNQTSSNIIYRGDYKNPDDLSDMYQKVDLVWCFELLQEEGNSKWLLPNRLYEGGYFELPMIAPRHFEVGNYLERYRIGWTFDTPYEESLITFFNHLTIQSYLMVKKNFDQLSLEKFASTKDFSDMCNTIEKLSNLTDN